MRVEGIDNIIRQLQVVTVLTNNNEKERNK
jgi:hypothetical protein